MSKVPKIFVLIIMNIFTVENEVHFLLSCSLFNEERQKFLDESHMAFPNTATLDEFNMFLWLMSQEDYSIRKQLGSFCKKSLEKRKKFFENN